MMNSDKVCNSRGVDTSANMKKKKAVTLHYQLGNEREFLKKVFKVAAALLIGQLIFK